MTTRRQLPLVFVAVALLVLIVLLAALQWRWLGRVSEAERDHLQAMLGARVGEFASDIDREITRAYLTFQSPGLEPEVALDARIAQLVDRWQGSSRFPNLIEGVFVATSSQSDAVELRRFDVASRTLRPVPWPPRLRPLEARIEGLKPGPPRAGQRVVLRTIPPPITPDAAAIVVPMPSIHWWRGGPGADKFTVPDRMDFTILALDDRYLGEDLLPSLAEHYFSSLADGVAYDVAVVDATTGAVVYRSSPTFDAHAAGRGDASADFFQVRTQHFAALAAEVRRFTFLAAALPPGSGAGRGERSLSILLQQRPDGDAPAGAPSPPPDAGPRYRLVVVHPMGSLDAAVASARHRNLWLGSGILALLAASIGLLMVATRRAQALARQQMEFVATVSHELRTPLAVIRSAADNLADGVIEDGAQIRRYGELVRTEGRRLTDLVEQTLEYSGLQSGRPPHWGPVALSAIVREAVGACEVAVRSQGIVFDVDLADDLPAVVGDENALRRVVQNLLSNAVKYGADGRWVGVQGRRTPRGVQLRVADRGRGLAASEQARIFDPFYRTPDVVAAQIQGAGLGLSLVRRIVQACGGRVSVASAPGEGTCFVVDLPASDASAAVVPSVAAPSSLLL